LRRHQFGLQPTKIIWFQVAGFEEEQIALLRFKEPAEYRTSFENSICIGNSWSYNYYKLRPSSFSTFLAQATGSKNIKNDCTDFQKNPIWKYLSEAGYSTGVIESTTLSGESILEDFNCEPFNFLSDLMIWKRSDSKENSKTYLSSQKILLKKNEVFYDRSCGKIGCETSLTENIISISRELGKNNDKYLLIVRDFSYLQALRSGDFNKARNILKDLERSFSFGLDLAKKSDDYLILLTTADSMFLDLPDQGVNWFNLEHLSKLKLSRKSKLTNLVLASGSRSENFCGIYEDSELFERILSGPKQQGLEFKFINPLKI